MVKISEIKIAENTAVKTGMRFEKTFVRLTPISLTVIVKNIKANEIVKLLYLEIKILKYQLINLKMKNKIIYNLKKKLKFWIKI